jgi:uncharacterized protein YyaL (SSP411 family)
LARNFRVATFVAILLPACVAVAAADEVASVAWHSDVAAAWSATREHGRPLLVFVTSDACAFCTRMKDGTYGHPAIAAAINRSFVPLVLNGGDGTPLVKELNVKAFPCTIVISPQAVVLARIDGYVSPQDLAQRLSQLQPRSGVAARTPGG